MSVMCGYVDTQIVHLIVKVDSHNITGKGTRSSIVVSSIRYVSLVTLCSESSGCILFYIANTAKP